MKAFLILGLGLVLFGLGGEETEAGDLKMSKAVVCEQVHGYASFEVRPDAKLTADDKLTIYYEPSGYEIETVKGNKKGQDETYRALLFQDGRLRKKGRKEPLWNKDRMFEYEAKSPSPPYRIYMRIDVSIKGLPPGDYAFDLVLHDGLKPGAEVARQTVEFHVVEPPARKDS